MKTRMTVIPSALALAFCVISARAQSPEALRSEGSGVETLIQDAGLGARLREGARTMDHLPAVVEAAKLKGPAMEKKWKDRIDALLAKEEHVWKKGLSAKEAEALRKNYQDRYNQ